VYNVANACATGATALRTVIMAIKAGEAELGLAVGVEQMGKMGLLGSAGRAKDARQVFEPSGRYGSVISTEGVVELHDCFATAELVGRDGRIPVNVSGGLLSKGHPLGATGIANVYEVATHLRGEAGDRQIDGAKVGLTHVIGLGSACAVHILERSSLTPA
jgi:acetyl-CoA acetyltransferase